MESMKRLESYFGDDNNVLVMRMDIYPSEDTMGRRAEFFVDDVEVCGEHYAIALKMIGESKTGQWSAGDHPTKKSTNP